MNILQRFAAFVARIPVQRQAVVNLRHEPLNATSGLTTATIQSYIREAEAGDTRQLFALYRDLTVAGSHVQAEFSKRKLAVLGQPWSVLPVDADNPDDVKAVAAVKQMIANCENWTFGLTHLLDSALWPVAVAEKIYRPVDAQADGAEIPRYTLRRLEPVNPTLLCFRQPYAAAMIPPGQRAALGGGLAEVDPLNPPFEPDVRFYSTEQDGRVNYNWETSYAAEKDRHLFHRGHLLVGARDCWGGPMRSILFWWLLGTLARDWFGRGMERYGAPFIVGKTDASNADSVTLLQDAFSLSTKIGGLVVDHETAIELEEIAASGMADAHEKFINVCHREISKVVVGQTLSAEAQSTGLGSSVGKLQGEVRDDIRMFDQIVLGETLQRQLFDPFLKINGLRGAAPKIVWGSVSSEEIAGLSKLLVDLNSASLEPTDEAIPLISERVGFSVQRKAAPAPLPGGGGLASAAFSKPETMAAHPGSTLHTFAADALGVPPSWLNPLKRHFTDIEEKVNDKSLSDADLIAFLELAARRVPELFRDMDIEALAEVFETGMSDATIEGVRAGLKKLAGKK